MPDASWQLAKNLGEDLVGPSREEICELWAIKN